LPILPDFSDFGKMNGIAIIIQNKNDKSFLKYGTSTRP